MLELQDLFLQALKLMRPGENEGPDERDDAQKGNDGPGDEPPCGSSQDDPIPIEDLHGMPDLSQQHGIGHRFRRHSSHGTCDSTTSFLVGAITVHSDSEAQAK